MGSFQTPAMMRSSSLLESSCGYLLQELQIIWDEVGEDQSEREKILLDIEQECLEVYRRKVDNANMARAKLHQELAEAESKLTRFLLSLGERSLPGRPERKSGTLKEQLESITPALKEMCLRRQERVNQFRAVQGQIQKISAEIAGRSEYDDSASTFRINENDLSLKKLEEYQADLQRLQAEKNERLQKVETHINTIKDLSATLGTDFSMTITKIHPSLNELCGIAKNISDDILAKLYSTVMSLEEEKQTRLVKLHQLGKALIDLWTLMDTPEKERRQFYQVTDLLSQTQIETSPGRFTRDIIIQAEEEVKRLDQLKATKMKELFIRKQFELEEICNKSHMEVPSRSDVDKILNLVNSGEIDLANLLTTMDEQICKAREEAASRKVIMEKVERWMLACNEEHWLDEYNRDENRYSVSRGAHKNLKRAERARIAVSKIPALVDMLITKTRIWEEERNKVFIYDEAPLLATLEEYILLRQEKEEEKQRQRMEKKIAKSPGATELNRFSSPRPGTASRPGSSCSTRRALDRTSNGSFGSSSPLNRRLSLSIQQMAPNSPNSPTKTASYRDRRKSFGHKLQAQPEFASPLREETATVVSSFSGPVSP